MNSGNFDLIAPMYDRLSALVFGRSIRNSQTCFFSHIPDRARILSLGGGTGWWLPLLKKMKPDTTVTFVDSSGSMIRQAVRHARGASGIEFIQGTISDVPLSRKYDVVFTFYFLDLFEGDELHHQMKEITNRTSAGALWLAADFVNENRWHTFMLSVMYRFFKVVAGMKTHSLPEWEREVKSFLTPRASMSFYGSFIRSHIGVVKPPGEINYQPIP